MVACVDTSVAIKWLFAESFSPQADALLDEALDRQQPLVAPPLLPIEVTNVIWQRIRAEGRSLDDGEGLLAQFLAFPVRVHASVDLHREALRLAAQHALPATYDAHCVALAQQLGLDLWTADQRLVRTLAGRLPFVRWLGDYPAPPPRLEGADSA